MVGSNSAFVARCWSGLHISQGLIGEGSASNFILMSVGRPQKMFPNSCMWASAQDYYDTVAGLHQSESSMTELESAPKKNQSLDNLISEVTSHYFCHVLLLRRR